MFISIVYCYTQFCSIQEYTKERKKQSVFENLHERQQQQKNLFTEFDPLSFACSLPYCLNFSCVYLFEFTIISIKKKWWFIFRSYPIHCFFCSQFVYSICIWNESLSNFSFSYFVYCWIWNKNVFFSLYPKNIKNSLFFSVMVCIFAC